MSETQVVDPIAAAIAAAQATAAASIAAAAAGVGASTGLAVPPAPAATAVVPAAPLTAGVPMTMEDIPSNMIVDIWLKVSEHGLVFGANNTLVIAPMPVVIDLTAIQPCTAIKFGNPATYYKTFDNVLEAKGGSWATARANAERAGGKTYPSCDVPMQVVEDVKDISGKIVVAEAGKVLGNSLSTTNWQNWQRFYQECVKAGYRGQKVLATIGYEKRTNKAGNVWGVLTFQLTGVVSN